MGHAVVTRTAAMGVARLASFALPSSDRPLVLADLSEVAARERRPVLWIARQTLGIAAHVHLEAYRDAHDRARILLLLVAASGLWAVIPLSTWQLFGGTDVFTDPVGRAVVAVWRASHLTAACATGLLLGRASWLDHHADAARWHLAAVLVTAGLIVYGPGAGLTAGAALVAALWVGAENREHLGHNARPGTPG